MAGLTGFEPAASCVTGRRSNRAELQPLLHYKYNPISNFSKTSSEKFLIFKIKKIQPPFFYIFNSCYLSSSSHHRLSTFFNFSPLLKANICHLVSTLLSLIVKLPLPSLCSSLFTLRVSLQKFIPMKTGTCLYKKVYHLKILSL